MNKENGGLLQKREKHSIVQVRIMLALRFVGDLTIREVYETLYKKTNRYGGYSPIERHIDMLYGAGQVNRKKDFSRSHKPYRYSVTEEQFADYMADLLEPSLEN